MKTRHIHICIDDETYFDLLYVQSKTGLSKTRIIEDLIKEKKKWGRLIYEKR